MCDLPGENCYQYNQTIEHTLQPGLLSHFPLTNRHILHKHFDTTHTYLNKCFELHIFLDLTSFLRCDVKM